MNVGSVRVSVLKISKFVKSLKILQNFNLSEESIEMEKTLRNKTITLSKEAAFIILTVVCAVVLPQIFHAVGVLIGVGGMLGQIFLPMYIPVLMVGFCRGPATGAIAGLLSPIVSFSITGMPSAALLPFITLELVATGLLAGLFFKAKLPAVLRVLSVQVMAKAVRLVAFAISLYTANGTVVASTLFAGVFTSVPGIILQLILVTFLIMKKETRHE